MNCVSKNNLVNIFSPVLADLKDDYNDEIETLSNVVDSISGERYSTEEKCIGCWIDGRPIYRRVYHFATAKEVSSNQAFTIISGSSSLYEVERIINFDLMSVIPNRFDYYGNPYPIIFRQGNLSRQDGCLILSNGEGVYFDYLIMTYIKNTDAENSFTPSMVQDVSSENIDINAAINQDKNWEDQV